MPPDRAAVARRPVPVGGILALVLWIVGTAIIESAGAPDEDAAAQVIATYYEENAGAILAGSFVFMLGAAVFVWFLGGVRERVARAEAGLASGRLSTVVFGAGLLTAAMTMAFVAPEAAAAFGADQIDRALEPATAEALSVLGDGFFIAAEASVAVFFLATALAALRLRAFPGWLGWLSLVLGVAALLPWVGWAALIWGLPLWVLAASVWVVVAGPAAPPEPERRSVTQ